MQENLPFLSKCWFLLTGKNVLRAQIWAVKVPQHKTWEGGMGFRPCPVKSGNKSHSSHWAPLPRKADFWGAFISSASERERWAEGDELGQLQTQKSWNQKQRSDTKPWCWSQLAEQQKKTQIKPPGKHRVNETTPWRSLNSTKCPFLSTGWSV